MKKISLLALLALALCSGGCSLPISPLLFLIKDNPAPLHPATPDSPQPAQTPPPAPIAGDEAPATA